MAAGDGGGGDEAGGRGRLTVADRAVSRLVRAAVLTAPGVAPASRTSGVVSGALGRDLPRVEVARAGTQVDVEVEVASLWPRAAADTADAVRSAVTAQLASMASLSTGAVSVAVVAVVRPRDDRGEHRRVS